MTKTMKNNSSMTTIEGHLEHITYFNEETQYTIARLKPPNLAGAVIVRQRPGSAKGFVFLTLEDESGILEVVLFPRVWARLLASIRPPRPVCTAASAAASAPAWRRAGRWPRGIEWTKV